MKKLKREHDRNLQYITHTYQLVHRSEVTKTLYLQEVLLTVEQIVDTSLHLEDGLVHAGAITHLVKLLLLRLKLYMIRKSHESMMTRNLP